MTTDKTIADDLCRTFCQGIEVHSVPAGWAVGTPLVKPDGDRIGFFLVRGGSGTWRIEDDGFTVPTIIGSGIDLLSGERSGDFQNMLNDAEVVYEDGELRTDWISEAEVSRHALRFASLLLRLCDLAMLHPDKIRRTFKEDAIAAIQKTFNGLADIELDGPVAERLADFKADAVLRHVGLAPLAVFIATSDNRVYEAVLARQLAKQFGIQMRFAAVLESENPPGVTAKVRQRARNYLDASPSFVGDPEGAMGRLLETIGLEAPVSVEELPSVH